MGIKIEKDVPLGEANTTDTNPVEELTEAIKNMSIGASFTYDSLYADAVVRLGRRLAIKVCVKKVDANTIRVWRT